MSVIVTHQAVSLPAGAGLRRFAVYGGLLAFSVGCWSLIAVAVFHL